MVRTKIVIVILYNIPYT